MRASLSLLCTQTQENPLPIHAVDPDTTSAGDGWWPERRRTARKEPPFCSMRRAGAAFSASALPRPPPPLPPSSYGACLPTRRDQRGIPMAGSGCGLILAGGREIPRADHGGKGGAWLGRHEAWRRGGLFSPPLYLPSPWRWFGLAALALLAWRMPMGVAALPRLVRWG